MLKTIKNKTIKTLGWIYLISLILLALPFTIAGFFFHIAKESFFEGGEGLFDVLTQASNDVIRK